MSTMVKLFALLNTASRMVAYYTNLSYKCNSVSAPFAIQKREYYKGIVKGCTTYLLELDVPFATDNRQEYSERIGYYTFAYYIEV